MAARSSPLTRNSLKRCLRPVFPCGCFAMWASSAESVIFIYLRGLISPSGTTAGRWHNQVMIRCLLLFVPALLLTAQANTVVARNFKESGSPSAPITLEIYTDYECPHCRAFYLEVL